MRAGLRKTRSGAVTEAIERWLQSEEVGDDERRYLEGYLRHPERAEDSGALAGAIRVAPAELALFVAKQTRSSKRRAKAREMASAGP